MRALATRTGSITSTERWLVYTEPLSDQTAVWRVDLNRDHPVPEVAATVANEAVRELRSLNQQGTVSFFVEDELHIVEMGRTVRFAEPDTELLAIASVDGEAIYAVRSALGLSVIGATDPRRLIYGPVEDARFVGPHLLVAESNAVSLRDPNTGEVLAKAQLRGRARLGGPGVPWFVDEAEASFDLVKLAPGCLSRRPGLDRVTRPQWFQSGRAGLGFGFNGTLLGWVFRDDESLAMGQVQGVGGVPDRAFGPPHGPRFLLKRGSQSFAGQLEADGEVSATTTQDASPFRERLSPNGVFTVTHRVASRVISVSAAPDEVALRVDDEGPIHFLRWGAGGAAVSRDQTVYFVYDRLQGRFSTEVAPGLALRPQDYLR